MAGEFSAAAYAYDLPPELIARKPPARRGDSRLLVLHRQSAALEHKQFRAILDYLAPPDLLVFNDTRVLPARLLGQKVLPGNNRSGRARCEVFLLKQLDRKRWECLVKPGRRLPEGSVVSFGPDCSAGILDVLPDGRRLVEFEFAGDFQTVLDHYGRPPLPPYIKPDAAQSQSDRLELAARYQTVYARVPGASAAPTAGLHFSPELLAAIKTRGIPTAFLTLHIGLGTFQPLKTADIREHRMHTEEYILPAQTIRAVQACRQRGGRVIAVGTTAARVLETVAADIAASAVPAAGLAGCTSIYIYPGYKFRVVDALLTNFHLPGSTLLLLVSALAGREKILQAYQEAVRLRYRFFSFGDAMLIV
ncbi:MAG: tRNA preQ1(34) S-adenosylmethionine ribosyltransferase-isomerase QueA [Candidatus Margulisbacteria bacterium]|jgi:S-adenosylmethionine:tRNA ribosyltransferase-isomerase|nr:tRNA preQ1(34) S-adenosylmethionine ribosyltransferase-isomerase QueA [Candidatus Margulisiibacteriota bacterium]